MSIGTGQQVEIIDFLARQEELYEGAEFAGTEQIVSGIFPELTLTVEQIIWAGAR